MATPAREHVRWASSIAVDAPEAVATLRSYTSDMVGRYYGCPATDAEVDAAIAEEPRETFAPPHAEHWFEKDLP